ncbi:MAG: carbohydrate ABC transporter permease, partial [Pseudomonadota bacterium]
MKTSLRLSQAATIAGQLIIAAIILLPFFWMVSVSLKPADEPFAIPANLWPNNPTFDNYVSAFRPEFRTYFVNSVIVSLSTVIITISLGLFAAYTFTRTQTRAILVCMLLIIAAQMFPASAIIIPIYQMMNAANLLNTYASLILAYITITLPVAIWMLRAFMARLPVALDEAAAVDGCGPFRTFFLI